MLVLIEPWWKTLRPLALAGRFFDTWGQAEEAISRAADYWNARRPYARGRQATSDRPQARWRGHADHTGGV